MLCFIYEDCKVPKDSFRLGFMLRLSERSSQPTSVHNRRSKIQALQMQEQINGQWKQVVRDFLKLLVVK
ncbi:hypothetical protein E2562_023498 [Oryza meyeriana var. granulata]|uniref:Uncharacterized protein n=1 Tax=Oryza meyeriana var. granulata TaxID=110450 RepID=A0A6G1BY42_9ORYZ|nr:hypothetical protein E2562_023498 [Oryza meyeriana var. granulata]